MYNKTVNYGDEIDSSLLPTHLADSLRHVEARAVRVESSRVLFKGGAFRLVGSWNVLSPFGFGDMTVDADRHQVQYRLSFLQLLLIATAGTLFLAVFGLIMSRSWYVLAAIPFWWLWMVVGNLAIGLGRFESFVQSAIATAPRLSNDQPGPHLSAKLPINATGEVE